MRANCTTCNPPAQPAPVNLNGGFSSKDHETAYMKALFFLVYSMQNALSSLIEKSHGELECQRFVSFSSFSFMKTLIKKLAHMDKQKQYKPLFSGACTDLYRNLRRIK
jgi:hypothetical protein